MIPEIKINQHLRDAIPLPQQIGGSDIALVTGGNATGKSLLRKLFYFKIKQLYPKCTVWHFSQELKKSHHSRVFLGDESDESTGFITVKNTLKAIRLIKDEANLEDKSYFIIYDEPEIGLSEETSLSLALRLKDFLIKCPKALMGMVVLTHNRNFVNVLKDLPSLEWLNLDGFSTAHEWLDREIKPTDLEHLLEIGNNRWRSVSSSLKKIKESKDGSGSK